MRRIFFLATCLGFSIPLFAQNRFELRTQDGETTTLSIILLDKHGLALNSTPQLQITDTTGKLVRQFYRTVDERGAPDLLSIAPGRYNIKGVNRIGFSLSNVDIKAGKNNELHVTVDDGTLCFRYYDKLGDTALKRPVVEYDALVTHRNTESPTVKHHCSTERNYAPGSYYVKVNTLPASRFSIDIDFATVTEIDLEEPGSLEITSASDLEDVTLYTPQTGASVRF